MKFCLLWSLDKVGTSYSNVWNIISGLCWLLNSICAWTRLDSTDRQITANLRPCSSIFFIYSTPLQIWREWEGEEIIVLSVLVANCTFWVRQYSWSWKHSCSCVTTQDVRPPQCCALLPTNPIEEALGQSKSYKIVFFFTLLIGAVFCRPTNFFFYGRQAYLWTIIWHHVHIPPTRCSLVICRVCSPPCYVTQWVAFFLFSPPPLHQHTNI